MHVGPYRNGVIDERETGLKLARRDWDSSISKRVHLETDEVVQATINLKITTRE